MDIESQFEFSTISNLEDGQRLKAIASQCFGSSLEWQDYFNRLGLDNFRLIRKAGQPVGGLAIYQMGQWYGSRAVPMAGIAAVGVAPEHRGTGVAYQLMSRTLEELYHKGVPLSALYAAAQTLYRKVGYEQAGIRCRWKIATDSIGLKDRRLPIERVMSVQAEKFQDIYELQAKVNNGNLARNQALWEQIVKSPKEQTLYVYIIGSKKQPEGYIIFTQNQTAEGLTIDIKDWAILTITAAKRFWTFLADHRSQVDQVRWYSSPIDALTLLLPEQTAEIASQDRWMLRIVDVPKALEKRGYPEGIETELHLQVYDDLLPQNNGKFVLQIAKGRGKVKKGGKGEFSANVRGLSPLYTGLFTPEQLQLTGYLDSTQEALSRATQVFSGSPPWMPDFF